MHLLHEAFSITRGFTPIESLKTAAALLVVVSALPLVITALVKRHRDRARVEPLEPKVEVRS